MNEDDFYVTILSLVPLNRTIVSDGSDDAVSKLLHFMPDGKILEYPSGTHSSNWYIPPFWKVESAFLKDLDSNEVLVSSEESVLFVAPYSKSCNQTLSKSELISITLTSPENPETFKYQHRLAYDPTRNLNEVSISLPDKLLTNLSPDHMYNLVIRTTYRPGTMKVFEARHSGTTESSIYLLSHYCHSGQLNDGLGGVYVMGRVMERLKKSFKTPKMNYVWLSFPETIGSSVYLSDHEDAIVNGFASIFCEMPGAVSDVRVTMSRRANSYIDRILEYVLTTSEIPFTAVAFREGWGNDEMVFDSPIVGIPSVSVDRAPFANYHLSSDDVSKFNLDKANQIIELVFRLLSLIERDYIPEPQFTVPPQLSRFGLYQDWTINREGYKSVMTLLDSLDGKTSVLDIALRNRIEVEFTFNFFEKLKLENLIIEHPLNAQYARKSF